MTPTGDDRDVRRPGHAGRVDRRRSLGSGTGIVAGLLVLGLAACSSAADDRARSTSGTAATSVTAPVGSAAPTDPSVVAPGPSGATAATTERPAGGATTIAPADPPAVADPASSPVATLTVTFVDPARARTLPTTVYFPASGVAATRPATEPAAEAGPGAAPAGGAFPLVLFAHGYLLPGDGYARMLRAVAARGFVVAAPEFPHTSAHGGDGLRSDLTNQPADLSFVADRLVELAAAGSSLPPIADPSRIAVVGHSDGGLTATALGYGQQFRDPRVAAVVSLTGGIGLFPGAFLTEADPPPVLAVHARDDGTNPYSASTGLVASVPAGRPRLLLTVAAGGHIDPYMYGTGRPELGAVIAGFLELTLGRDPSGLERLRAVVAVAPDLALEER